ncbi:hypothetical protein [Tengunoibacter tsumagoiensis]|uniref:Uncharacterized protein n=1 Tax=Tengunoibacter tsumagoiensis TaxID=2014871 RepID=A0A401ZVN3_9CHLR|nr:hypothetical protein [Tengunoibacter tsumagoiensis]GCE10978.1 hypothetical protein KTT_08370 [Tengunoibacter tsumagoiensis]
MIRDMEVKVQLNEMYHTLKDVAELASDLKSRAILHEITNLQYEELSDLAYEGISFIEPLKAGDIFTPEWISMRDNYLSRIRRFILDAPNFPDNQQA